MRNPAIYRFSQMLLFLALTVFNASAGNANQDETVNWLVFYNNGLTRPAAEITVNEEFSIGSPGFTNLNAETFQGSVRAALYSRDGENKEWISSEVELPQIPSGGEYTAENEIRCTITQTLEPGDRIRLFCRTSGSEDWYLVESSSEGVDWEIIVLQETIANSTSFSYDADSGYVILVTFPEVSYSLALSETVILSGTSDAEGRILISTADLSEDVYVLTLSLGTDVKTLEFAVKPLNPEE